MEENNVVVEPNEETESLIAQIAELSDKIRTLQSDNRLLSETIIRMTMKNVGVI